MWLEKHRCSLTATSVAFVQQSARGLAPNPASRALVERSAPDPLGLAMSSMGEEVGLHFAALKAKSFPPPKVPVPRMLKLHPGQADWAQLLHSHSGLGTGVRLQQKRPARCIGGG